MADTPLPKVEEAEAKQDKIGLETLLEPSQFLSYEELVFRYPKPQENCYAVEQVLGKVRTLFKKFGYRNIKKIKIHEAANRDVVICYHGEEGKVAIIGCILPEKNYIVMSKPERIQAWVNWEI